MTSPDPAAALRRCVMMIKVCGITRREDALAALEAGASAVGFIFYPQSPRYVTPEEVGRTRRGCGHHEQAFFVDETAARIAQAVRAAALHVAQIYGGSAPRVGGCGKHFEVFPDESVSGAEAVLIDGPQSGTPFDWRMARGIAEKLIIAGGLDESNVADAIRITEPWGVDASSRLESSPGIKDHARVRGFVKAALAAYEVRNSEVVK